MKLCLATAIHSFKWLKLLGFVKLGRLIYQLKQMEIFLPSNTLNKNHYYIAVQSRKAVSAHFTSKYNFTAFT